MSRPVVDMSLMTQTVLRRRPPRSPRVRRTASGDFLRTMVWIAIYVPLYTTLFLLLSSP